MSAIKANSAAILAPGDKAKRAVVRVGEVGRGFVVEGRGNERYVVPTSRRTQSRKNRRTSSSTTVSISACPRMATSMPGNSRKAAVSCGCGCKAS